VARTPSEVGEESPGNGQSQDVLGSAPGDVVEVDWAASEEVRAIGAKIRQLRQALGLSLRDLGSRTGLSIGYLSLVERGRSSLALTSLYATAKALGTDVGYFFPSKTDGSAEALPSTPTVVRAGEDTHVAITSSKRLYRLLSQRASGKVLEPLRVTIQPTDTDAEPYSHDGEEFCYVLEGELTYLIGDEEHRLGPGDSIHLDSTTPHAIRNESGRAVEAVWVLTPPLLR
jgi:transcriptional regulator with XRE-family HTH domain